MSSTKLTDVQKYMIGTIQSYIKNAEDRIEMLQVKKIRTIAETEELVNLQSKLKQFKKQLIDAKKPVKKTPEQLKKIDELVNNIKIEVDGKEEKEMEKTKTATVKVPTGKDLFEKQLSEYISNVKDKSEELEKLIPAQESILDALNKIEITEANKTLVKDEIDARIQLIKKLRDSKKAYAVILRMHKNKFENKLLDNYDELKKIDVFLNGVFNFQDKAKTIEAMAKKYKIED